MRIKEFYQPRFLMPLAVISPVLPVMRYGVRISDIIIILMSFYFLVVMFDMNYLNKSILIFLTIFTFSWLMSRINGYKYDIPITFFDVNHFYRRKIQLLKKFVAYYGITKKIFLFKIFLRKITIILIIEKLQFTMMENQYLIFCRLRRS